MAHTNSTPNYNLPQFVSSDKPAWLSDINAAYADIDTGMKRAQDAADDAQSDATQALLDASTASATATSADAKASGAIASMAATFSDTSTYSVGNYVIYNNILYKCIVAVTVPGPWSGTLNWERASISSVVDDLKSEINGLTASDIDYDTNNTVADKIEDIESNLNDYVKLITNILVSDVNVGANTEYNSSTPIQITNIPAGYKVIAVCNVRCYGYYGSRFIGYAWLSGSNSLSYTIYNPTTLTTARVSLAVDILCIRE